jgi:hypothetical protein
MTASVLGPHRAPALTKEQSRQALVEWVKSQHDEILDMSLDFLRTAPMKEETVNGVFHIGSAYRIDLNQRTFVITVISEVGFAEYSGQFVFDKQSNTWKAFGAIDKQT